MSMASPWYSPAFVTSGTDAALLHGSSVSQTLTKLTAAIDVHYIASLLHQAGQQILLPMFARQQDLLRQHKADASIVTEADLRCQQQLQQQLAAWCHQRLPQQPIGFLGEEMEETEQLACLQSQGTYWCLDPLDGTGNFAGNIPLFSISLALVHQGKPCMAWVHDPIRRETFSATQGGGVCLNGRRLPLATSSSTLAEATGFVDFKRLSETVRQRLVTPSLYRSQRNLGSCALEWAWLAAGRGSFMIHGGQRLWDYAAGALLCSEAGCMVNDFSGQSPFASAQLSSSIVAACDSSLQLRLLREIQMR